MSVTETKKSGGIVDRIRSGYARIMDALRGWEDGELNSPQFTENYNEFIEGIKYTLDAVDSPYIVKEDLVKVRSRGVVVRLAVGSKDYDPVQVAYLKHKGVNVSLVDQETFNDTPLRPLIGDFRDLIIISPFEGKFASVRGTLRLAEKLADDFNALVTPI